MATEFCYVFLLIIQIHVSLSDPDCKYFSLNDFDGPYFAIDVCNEYQFYATEQNIKIGSYKYECLNGNVVARYWRNSDKCDGSSEYYTNSYETNHKKCEGDICNHVQFKTYQQLYPNQDLCAKNEQKYFIEYALVTDCWNQKWI